MPKIPGVNHQDAVRALEKAGLAYTMGDIVRDAGLSERQFRDFL